MLVLWKIVLAKWMVLYTKALWGVMNKHTKDHVKHL